MSNIQLEFIEFIVGSKSLNLRTIFADKASEFDNVSDLTEEYKEWCLNEAEAHEEAKQFPGSRYDQSVEEYLEFGRLLGAAATMSDTDWKKIAQYFFDLKTQ